MDYFRSEEKSLFEIWKALFLPSSEACNFVADGVVDETEWFDTPFNILVLLKEVNGGEGGWDEREYLSGYYTEEKYINSHSPSIDALLYWLHGLFHCTSDMKWDDVCNSMTQENNAWLLRQIAIVNVKKISGAGVASMKDVDAFFNYGCNQFFLSEQLDIYENTNLVICGGTGYYLKNLNEKYSPEKWKKTHTGIEYLRIGNTVYLDFVHPLARIPKNILFYTLLETVEEIQRIEKTLIWVRPVEL